MTKHQLALKEAEAFVRKAISRISGKPVSKKSIRAAAHKITKAMPSVAQKEHRT